MKTILNYLLQIQVLQTDVFLDEIKTTNVNILLNRVRIEKKNNFKKKILLFIFNAYNNFCYFYCNNLKLNIYKNKDLLL